MLTPRHACAVVCAGLVACSADPGLGPSPGPQPGPLLVGAARVRMPVPVGIGTVGNNALGVSAEPSPFAEIFPATTRVHNHPDFRAMVASRGPGFEVVFLRSDTVGVFAQFRVAVALELEARLGRSFDDALLFGGTHTHSGPGRLIDAEGPFELAADSFHPEFYLRMVDAAADAVEQAYVDLKPGRLGYAQARCDEGIDDRRCEDGLDYTNGTLPVIAIEQEGALRALTLAYAIHGTVLGIDELTISQDVSGGIEQAVEDRFDHPVQVAMFNSWGADMSPATPDIPLQEGAVQPGGYDKMERVGSVVADAVDAVVGNLVWTDEPVIELQTHRAPIDRDAIGYDPATFVFPHGGLYCQSVTDEDCDAGTRIEDLDQACLPLSEEVTAPTQTLFTAGRVGDLHLITFPGEPGTLLAEQVVERLQEIDADIGDVAFFGYTQDYLGYSILEEDWWQGGYEASGAMWGPRQGAYLADQAVLAFARTVGALPQTTEPEALPPFDDPVYTPHVATTPVDLGVEQEAVAASYGPTDVVQWTVAGGDPWLGTPIATLFEADGTPVLRPNGLPLTSEGQGFWVGLVPEPGYRAEPDAPARMFRWQFSMPVQHQVPGAGPTLAGDYKLSVELPDGSGGVTVESAVFSVGP